MTFNGWIQIAIFRDRRRAGEAARPVHDRRLQRRAQFSFAGAAADRARPLSPCRNRREAGQDWLTYAVAMLLFHVGGFFILYRFCGCKACCRSIRRHGGRARISDLQHDRQLHHQHQLAELRRREHAVLSVQMLGLTHQNFLSAATGIVLAIALIRGFARASAKTVGNFWVDITRCTLYILHPDLHSLCPFPVWQGIPQTLGAYVDATTLEGASRPSRSAPSRRSSPSRCSAPMAAASSTPMRRTPSRTRRRCRILSRSSRSSCSARR